MREEDFDRHTTSPLELSLLVISDTVVRVGVGQLAICVHESYEVWTATLVKPQVGGRRAGLEGIG